MSIDFSDQDLLSRVRNGDTTAFGDLYAHHSAAAHRAARRITRDPHLAEDIVSESFARVFKALRSNNGPQGDLFPYLLVTMRNVAANWGRTSSRVTSVGDDLAFQPRDARDLVAGADEAPVDSLNMSLTSAAFQTLPARWRTVLWYLEVEGESAGEVGARIGLSDVAVRQLAKRAREGLREAYLTAYLGGTPTVGEHVAAADLVQMARGKISLRRRRIIEPHLDTCAQCTRMLFEAAEENSTLRALALPFYLAAAIAVAKYSHGLRKKLFGWVGENSRRGARHGRTVAAVAASAAVIAAVAVAAIVVPHLGSHRANAGADRAGATGSGSGSNGSGGGGGGGGSGGSGSGGNGSGGSGSGGSVPSTMLGSLATNPAATSGAVPVGPGASVTGDPTLTPSVNPAGTTTPTPSPSAITGRSTGSGSTTPTTSSPNTSSPNTSSPNTSSPNTSSQTTSSQTTSSQTTSSATPSDQPTSPTQTTSSPTTSTPATSTRSTSTTSTSTTSTSTTSTSTQTTPTKTTSSSPPPHSDKFVNIALGRPATASSTQEPDGANTYVAGNATDGDLSTRWSSACGDATLSIRKKLKCDVPGYSPTDTLAVDLGKSQAVRRLVLNWEHAYARKFGIEVSDDGINWTRPLADQSDATFVDTPDGPTETVSLSVQTRWIRIVCTKRAQDNAPVAIYGYSLHEFEVDK